MLRQKYPKPAGVPIPPHPTNGRRPPQTPLPRSMESVMYDFTILKTKTQHTKSILCTIPIIFAGVRGVPGRLKGVWGDIRNPPIVFATFSKKVDD